jgi:branched-chain amino acid transport system substrate-binding protein
MANVPAPSFDGCVSRALTLAATIVLSAFLTSPLMAQSGPVVIGGTLALTGPFAEPSTDYKLVYDRWLGEVNRKGGLLGRPVKMIVYNDESTPTVAQALYNKLLDQDKVDLVLAPYTTFVGGPIVPIVMGHQKILFNGGFTGLAIFRSNHGSIIGSYPYQEPDYTRGLFEMIAALPAERRPKRAAIFTLQNPFSVVVRAGFEGVGGALNFAKAAGVEVVLDEQYPPNTTDFTGLVRKAKAARADMVLALSLPNDTLNIARTMRQQDFVPTIFCTCGSPMTTLATWPHLGAAGEHAFGTTFSWPTQGFEGLAELAADFKARGQETIPSYAIAGYSILQIIEQAVQGAQTLDQEKLKAYILGHEFRTAAGRIRFQNDGTPTFNQVVIQFVGGKNEVVWPTELRTAQPLLSGR